MSSVVLPKKSSVLPEESVALHRHHCRPTRKSQGQDSEQYSGAQEVFKATAKHDREVFLNNLCDELETDIGQNRLGPAFKAIRLLSGKRKGHWHYHP